MERINESTKPKNNFKDYGIYDVPYKEICDASALLKGISESQRIIDSSLKNRNIKQIAIQADALIKIEVIYIYKQKRLQRTLN